MTVLRSPSRRRGRGRASAAGALLALVLLVPTSADAQESARCRKVRARASADAALLFAPSVVAQGIKFPENRTTDSGATVGGGYQFRAALAISPLDIYKGVQRKELGEAECAEAEARDAVARTLELGPDALRLPALRRAVAYLDAQAAERTQVLAKTEERLAAQVISLVDASEVRKRGLAISRRRAQLDAEARRIERRGEGVTAAPVGSIDRLVQGATGASMRVEKQASHLRSLEPWSVSVMGGVVPQMSPVDYFGVVQLGFNFGAFSRNANETKYLQAREEELAQARDEVSVRARLVKTDLAELGKQAREELAAADAEAERLQRDIEALTQGNTPAALHVHDILVLERQLADVERVLLRALAEGFGGPEERK